MSEFYTYLHCKPDGTPFYVGKGSGRRSHELRHMRNRYHNSIVRKYGEKNIGVFIFECDSEQQAFEDEVIQIAGLRRDGYELANLTDGGNDGIRGLKHTAETKQKIAQAKIGNTFGLGNKSRTGMKESPESNAKRSASLKGNTNFLGKKHSAESKAKTSAALKGRKVSEETREKMSEAASLRWARMKTRKPTSH